MIYFVFSNKSYQNKCDIAKKCGKKYEPGKVLDGVYKNFTDILNDETIKSYLYSDMIIVYTSQSNKLSNIIYKKPTII